MNKIIYVLYVAAAFLFAACESSVSSESEDGEISICMTLPPELSVDTRSGTIGGVTIDNVWVVQFLSDGSKLHAVHYDESTISNLGSSGALIQVATGGFSNVESTFRVIANFGASQAELVAFSKKEGAKSDDLKRIVVAYTDYQNSQNYLISDELPFAGVGSDGKAVIMAPLNYTYSWVDVKWTNKVVSPSRFTLQSIKAYNLPTTLALETRAGSTSGVYPKTSTGSYMVASSSADAGLGTGGTYTFYMPENLRGVGCGKSFQEKNLPEYGPKADGTAPGIGSDGKPTETGTVDNCTYIDLEGLYWYSYDAGSPTATSPISARYRLYLGGNLMNDYNVRRGYHYTITAQISGANSADVRVTITNGNVVVFDKVETIDKVVDF